jgi:hypothetical protein
MLGFDLEAAERAFHVRLIPAVTTAARAGRDAYGFQATLTNYYRQRLTLPPNFVAHNGGHGLACWV